MITAFPKKIYLHAFLQSLKKLNPFSLLHNPVIFISEIGAFVVTLEWIFVQQQMFSFYAWICIWLWLTVFFANFAESIAEIRNRSQAESLQQGRVEMTANVKQEDGSYKNIEARSLKKGDIVKVGVGEVIPGDGEIVEGMASIDESAVTGESAPVIRSAGGDHSSVTTGTKLVSDQIIVQISSNPGNSFLDRMIDLIE